MIAAASSLGASAGPQPELRGVIAQEIASVAKARALDLRLSQDAGMQRPLPFLRGMIVRHSFSPNAVIGLGLANIYAKKRVGSDTRSDGRPSRSRKPAVTFVLKF